MALTEFGRVVRIARIATDTTLLQQAQHLDVTSAFMSMVENGRCKVPPGMASRIAEYFVGLDFRFEQDLQVLADVANRAVPLTGLPFEHQVLVARLARAALSQQEIRQLGELLRSTGREAA